MLPSCFCANGRYCGSRLIAVMTLCRHVSFWFTPPFPDVVPFLAVLVHAGHPSVAPYLSIIFLETCDLPCPPLNCIVVSSSSVPTACSTSSSPSLATCTPLSTLSMATGTRLSDLPGTCSNGAPFMLMTCCALHLSSSGNLVSVLHLIAPCAVPMVTSCVLIMIPNHTPGPVATSPSSLRTMCMGKYSAASPEGTKGVGPFSAWIRSWGDVPPSPHECLDYNSAARPTNHAIKGGVPAIVLLMSSSNLCRNALAFSCTLRMAFSTRQLPSLSPTRLLANVTSFGRKPCTAACKLTIDCSWSNLSCTLAPQSSQSCMGLAGANSPHRCVLCLESGKPTRCVSNRWHAPACAMAYMAHTPLCVARPHAPGHNEQRTHSDEHRPH